MSTAILSRLTLLALSAAVVPATLVAADSTANNYIARLSGGVWLAPVEGQFAYGTGGGQGTAVELGELGLEDSEANLYVEANLQIPFFLDLHAGYWSFGTTGTGTLSQTIEFGGEIFNANETVNSSLDVRDLWAEVAWGINTDLIGASIGLAVHFMAIESTITSQSFGQSETFDESFPVPMLALRVHAHPLASLGFEFVGHGIRLDMSEVELTVLDLRLQAIWRPLNMLGVTLGYRHFLVDITAEDGDDRGMVDVTLSGPYAGLLAQF